MKCAVFGLGFGDEGKGLVTDYLCSHASKPALVVRFSGGHQCGHTVVDGSFRHVFSNFGSGTYRGVPTFWSKFCTVEPIGFINELEILKSKGLNPEIYIDGRCPVTTPYEIWSNRRLEHGREGDRHGSCGVGYGATWEREEKFYSLTFFDLFFPDVLREKLKNIRQYYINLGNFDSPPDLRRFLECCENMITSKHILPGKPTRIKDAVYEGSQGLLLDQHMGFFPNVTRSNTGSKNIKEAGIDEICLVTRAYQTRHGNGFMTNEFVPHKILENPNETNKQHDYQGKFRRSLLDLSLLQYITNKDAFIRHFPKKRLVITCLDHVVNDYRMTYRNKEILSFKSEDEFVKQIADVLEIDTVYLSHSDESKNITRWRK